MKVFVAGGTGAIGIQLVPQLVAAGHDVVATTRSARGAEEVQRLVKALPYRKGLSLRVRPGPRLPRYSLPRRIHSGYLHTR